MDITILENGTERSVSGLVPTAELSGAYNQACRTLSFSLVQDETVEEIKTALGQEIRLYEGTENLFSGRIFTRGVSADSKHIELQCRDRGIYLKKNRAAYSFSGAPAEEIARTVANDYGIPIGNLAKTGVGVTRLFTGDDLYSIIMTAYTKAAETTGKKYVLRFAEDKMNVFEKGVAGATILGDAESILTARYSESLERTITQVGIHDNKGNFLRNINNDALLEAYGLMREYIRQQKNTDAAKEAAKKLRDYGIERKASVENLGDPSLVTGDTVIIREKNTGLYGKFFIDEDAHRWKNGLYTNKLTLAFENMMDEAEAGQTK